MQNSRLAMASIHLVGVLATVAMFWAFVDFNIILLWAAAFLILLLLRSLHMSNALVERRFQTRPKRVYRQLLLGAGLTGLVWSGVYIHATSLVPLTMQYTFLMLIIMITALSIGFSVVIREYFIVSVFTSLWPIAWWSVVHYWQQPYNLIIGLVLLALCGLLVFVSDRVYTTFRNMIAINWEREAISQELGDLTGSLRDRNRQLRDARRQLTDLANVDELTGLGNRRLVNKALQEEINRARRSGAELSVILLDVDYFKNYNDTYGHPAGDSVLQKLADVMQRATTRAGEVVARYGGEEFILVLPGASSSSARRTAERLRDLVVEEQIPHETSKAANHVTVSQGVVTVRPDVELEPADLINRADKALYQAKDAGRNAIKVA
jgi:diguanylate cyclase (GGDEF)-like protein